MAARETTEKDTIEPARPPAKAEPKEFFEVVRALVGKPVTIVNPESFEPAPVGHQLKANFYRAKVISAGEDFLVLATEFKRSTKEGDGEPVKQYLPIAQIKRISLMRTDRLIHI